MSFTCPGLLLWFYVAEIIALTKFNKFFCYRLEFLQRLILIGLAL